MGAEKKSQQIVPNYAKRWAQLDKVASGCQSLFSVGAKPARLYLKEQGLEAISLIDVQRLYYHPSLPYKVGEEVKGRFPALIAEVHAIPNLRVNLYATYLTNEGKLAPLRAPRKFVNHIRRCSTFGAAVRLFSPQQGVLALSQEIEVAMQVHLKTGLPCWACLTRQGMEQVVLPKGIKKVYVMVNSRKESEKVGLRLASRLRQEGYAAHIQHISSMGLVDITAAEEGSASTLSL